MALSEPIRVIHIFGRMGRGGAENWLMNVLRRIDRERYRFDFLVHRERAGEFDDEIRAFGCQIHQVASWRELARYPVDFGKVVGAGKYHVVHSHVSHFSGYTLALARLLGARSRIAHSHTAVPTDGDSRWRLAYKRIMRQSIHLNATLGLGCSSEACAALFGPSWRQNGRFQRLFYGYDFDRFRAATEDARTAIRRELRVADDELVIGHIGRLEKPKNHDFIIDLIAASKSRGDGRYRFVLVGDGQLMPKVKGDVARRGLQDRVVMTGQRSDIPELLSGFDVLILPSLWEGLPVTILEGQATGVQCVISDRVSSEVVVLDDEVRQVPLADMNAWLQTVDAMARRPRVPLSQALARMNASEFSIESHVERVQQIYDAEAAVPREWSRLVRPLRKSL